MHKFKSLDGLRGLAALVVVLCHYANGFLPSLQGWTTATRHTPFDKLVATTPLHLALAGNLAVYIFFVLSGFVLSYKFFKTRSAEVLVSSAVRRYLRLMLPALGSILITYALLRSGLMFSHTTANITGSTTWLSTFWTFPAQFGNAVYQGVYGTFIHGQVTYNSSLWTMQIELLGSFLIFMFMALFGNLQKRWVFYVAFGIIFLNTSYLAFLLGMALSDIWANAPELKEAIDQKTAFVLLVIGLLLGAWYTSPAWPYIYSSLQLPFYGNDQLGELARILGAFLIIVSILRLSVLTKFFEHRVLQFLGRISFSLYLLHLVLLGSIASFLFNELVWRIGYAPAFLSSFAITLPITLAAAHYYTRFVDERAISVSRIVGSYLLSATHKSNSKETGAVDIPHDLVPATEVIPID